MPRPTYDGEEVEEIVARRVAEQIETRDRLRMETSSMVREALGPVLARMDEMTDGYLTLGKSFTAFTEAHVNLHEAEKATILIRAEEAAHKLGIPMGFSPDQQAALPSVADRAIEERTMAKRQERRRKFTESTIGRLTMWGSAILLLLTLLSTALGILYLVFQGTAHPLVP